MAKKKVTRKELLSTQDEFITFSTRLLQFVVKYKLQIAGVFGAVLALIIVFSGLRYFSNKAEDKAFAALEQGIIQYETAVKQGGPQKGFEAARKDFQPLLEKYSRKKAGKLARVYYANICYKAGEFDQAIALYKKGLEDFEDNEILKAMILSGLGYNYESKKDYQAAVRQFEIIASTPQAIMKDEALFNLGRIYAEIGQPAKSMEAYNKLVADYPDSMYYDLVKEKISGS
jgi:tetratricopeptide (TPR) repeat protein